MAKSIILVQKQIYFDTSANKNQREAGIVSFIPWQKKRKKNKTNNKQKKKRQNRLETIFIFRLVETF